MNKAASGNVTFLFTDIEGSTKLAQEFPDTYNSLIQQHDTILSSVIESNKGFTFKKVGDAFCCSFENTADALKAAHESQLKLNAHDWGAAKIRVRMGLHSGEAEYKNSDYVGYITLSRVNRIMSVAHGGQVLLTQEIYDTIVNTNPGGLSFRDLGERKLKDIILPEHVYQLSAEGLPVDFPPLKSLDFRPNNLPLQITKFIGREKEIDSVKQLLRTARMLTIVGPGGTGKTRLALRAANDLIDEFENGVWFVELSALNDPELIENEILQTLKLKEEGDKSIIDTLKEFLKDKQLLLIFDNSEHLLDKCASLVVVLLQSCARLKIISTSRESFNISGETIYKVPPLSVPDPGKIFTEESILEFESAKLFLDRAISIKHDFRITGDNVNALAVLCRRLDGIPFAIELAATRVNVLPVEKILERLNDRFKLLTRGGSTVLPHHQTLRALIDWSYDLLNDKEKVLLHRLSVFMGGWTYEAAEEICSDETIDEFEILDLLTSLENKSLINVVETEGMNRYNMLETIKQYCAEKFPDKSATMKKHLDYFLKLSDADEMKSKGIEQIQWIRMLDADLDNLRTAIQWSFEKEEETSFRFVYLLSNFWLIKGYFKDGYQIAKKALAIETVTDKKLRAQALLTSAEMCYNLGNFPELEKSANESMSLFREAEDKYGIAACLIQLGNVSFTNLDMQKAKEYFDEALKISNEIDSKVLKAKALRNLSFLENQDIDYTAALNLKEESLKIFREIKDMYNTAFALATLGIFEYQRGHLERANSFSEESLSIARENGDQYFISINLINLGRIYSEKKDFLKAEYFIEDSLKIIKEYGYSLNLHPALINLAKISKDKGDCKKAIETYKEFLRGSSNSGGNFFLKHALIGMSECYFKLKDFEQSLRLITYSEKNAEETKIKFSENESAFLSDYKSLIKEKLTDEKYSECKEEGLELSIEKLISY